jgi:methylated-DNA-[protein]-cysteine S-methyltransferase
MVTVDSPLGSLELRASAEGVTRLSFGAPPARETARTASPAAASHLAAAERALGEYFAGRRTGFDDVVLAPSGTAFERSVWKALREIRCGETTTYGALARDLGQPGAARAVGRANARNPIAILQPCHRVIGADGSLTGFGGGLPRKLWLLEHERRVMRRA